MLRNKNDNMNNYVWHVEHIGRNKLFLFRIMRFLLYKWPLLQLLWFQFILFMFICWSRFVYDVFTLFESADYLGIFRNRFCIKWNYLNTEIHKCRSTCNGNFKTNKCSVFPYFFLNFGKLYVKVSVFMYSVSRTHSVMSELRLG